MLRCWQLYVAQWAALTLQCAGQSIPGDDTELHYYGDNVIDLLEALNITRSVVGITKAKGPDPGVPAWKFRQRVPHLTLPWDYSVYLLSTVQAALGFHFVARQSGGSEGTLISLASPAATKRDGRPLLQLVSSTQADQLRLEYRTVHNLEPASLVFPGGTPLAHGRWARLALNLEPHRISLFVDCREPIVFEKEGGEAVLSLILPLDLHITFASLPGDKASKFLGYWQTAEISPSGFPHRPWHCENLPEPDLLPLPYTMAEEHYMEPDSPPPLEPLALTDIRHYQREPSQSDFPPPGAAQSSLASPEERIRRLEELVDGLGSMLDMVKEQNSNLLGRVKSLEECECRRLTCFWEGRRYDDGASWDQDLCTTCLCVRGKPECSLRHDLPHCLGCADGRKEGETWKLEPCQTCRCEAGTVSCKMEDCPPAPCQHPSTPEGKCCPECGSCLYKGHLLRDGQNYQEASCIQCVCKAGTVQCQGAQCPELACREHHVPPGECCPVCRPGCEYEGQRYQEGEVFVAASNPCMNCSCLRSLVRCHPRQCPSIRCAKPIPQPGQCCPTCPACELDGHPLEPGQKSLSADGCRRCSCSEGKLLCIPAQQCPKTCTHGAPPDVGSCCPDCTRCLFQGKLIPSGVEFMGHDPCERCVCKGGNVVCSQVTCPKLDCTTTEEVTGQCCPRCQGCVDGTSRYEHGEEWTPTAEPCLKCRCLEGKAACKRRQCASLCRHPARPRWGSCCPICDGCLWEGREYRSGELVQNGDSCERCRCRAGEVTCERLDVDCPPAPCSHPGKVPGQCCPSCDVCEFEARLYQNGETFTPGGSSPCLQCTCAGGHIQCQEEVCPAAPCPQPVQDPERCCPLCRVCVLDSVEFEEGTEWEPEGDPCSTCICLQGEPVCSATQCPPAPCQHPAQLQGSCCPTCQQCSYKQQLYSNGQEFVDPDSPCQSCRCTDGTVLCSPTVCPPVVCPHPERRPGLCCPKCPDCTLDNRVVLDGEEFPHPQNPCQACLCTSGDLYCTDRHCPGALCAHPLPGSCCQNNCNGCNYAGKEYPNGAEFPHPTDKCRQCHCINGNVQCHSARCGPLACPEPFLRPGECCPQCPAPPASCLYLGVSYQHTERFYDPSDKCRDCICSNGTVTCQRQPCAPVQCSHPLKQDCCRSCDGCLYHGKELPNGEQFADPKDPCGICSCWEGSVSCEPKACPPLECPFPISGPCCKNCEGCEYLLESYLDGQEFPDPRDACSLCSCLSGFVTCTKKPCYQAGCSHPANVPGQCCPVCHGCSYKGITVSNGQTFADPGDSLCSQCTCRAGSVQCLRKLCPPAPCAHPVPGPCACSLCQGCYFQGREYEDGQIFAAPNKACEDCRCRKGDVSCGARLCPVPPCPHPSRGPCGCPTCDGCSFHGRDCRDSERFPDPQDACRQCTCSGGTVTCLPTPCPPTSCKNPVALPGQCCPQCTGACHYQGRLYQSGETFASLQEACHTCVCLAEVVMCQPKLCPQQCTHPVPPTAPACCPTCDGCLFEGQKHASRQTFTLLSEPCQRCSCLHGNVACVPLVCPQVPCASPIRRPGQCCPECPVCQHAGQEYPEGAQWLSPLDPCQQCSCMNGEPSCGPVPCEEMLCSHPALHPGQCCPLCHDCLFEGQLYPHGQAFNPESCLQCNCQDGNVRCAMIQCPPASCSHPVTEPGVCCPRCKGCMYEGQERMDGSRWLSSSVPCMACMCVDGVATCADIVCISSCLHQIQVPGECCPLCADCSYDGHIYGPGESFQPGQDPCEICTCELMLDGEQHLQCYRKQCPSLVDCPRELIQPPGPGHCCPTCAQALSNCTSGLVGNEVHATDEPCYTCQCKDLTWVCVHQGCPLLSCPIAEQFTPHGACCPICDECVIEVEGRRVSDGETWRDSVDDCVTCSCSLGHIECHIEECVPVVCQDGLLKVQTPGRCCAECQDPGSSCSHQGHTFQSNERWQVDECTACTCISGEVHCHSKRCPPAACAADETPALIPGMCCPHCVPRPATCVAFGDPHYRTFDGKMIHFQGSCTYIMAQDCDGGDFSIHVTNDDRGRQGVSWTKEVTVLVGNTTVQLLQDRVVMVDSRTVTLPFLREPLLYVELKANTLLLNTNIGLKVLWNGRSHLEVSVPGTYKGRTCGLCGNFNSYPQDDLRLRSGHLTLSEATFGNSWKVVGANTTERGSCADVLDVDPCKETGYRSRKDANARCKVLKSQPFERCHAAVPPEPFFASCVYDLCACGTASSDDCLCEALEAYAAQCRHAGLVLQWRSPTLCAVGCPQDRGYVFDECGPPCPKTCFNHAVPLGVMESHCFKPCVAGCQCPAGLVEHEAHCILPEACPRIIYGSL
ncbi:kielin/chordin-like protein [Eublepharis macularius]|uniref:Kielin/chordin-like protein n=1 Tax=Eublepharis macularius TaxID=481883 RepID=A0AA97JW59_EUBMA|nr:kielin/chordin-like protein [Eublepharis macularius]